MIYFYAGLTLLYFVFQLINLFVYPDHRRSKRFTLMMVHCFRQSGTFLLSAYRVLAGVLLTCALIWTFKEPETATWDKIGQLVIGGGVCFVVANVLSAVDWKLARQTKESIERLDNDPFD